MQQSSPSKTRVANLQQQIRNEGMYNHDISAEDLAILIEFDEEIEKLNAAQNRIGDAHHADLLYYMHQFAVEVGGICRTLENSRRGEDAVDALTTWMDDQDVSGRTQESALSALRVFAHLMLDSCSNDEFDDEELPERFSKIDPHSHVDNVDPAPAPSEILSWEEGIKMAKEQDEPRDQALILTQLGAGLRPMSELYKLRFKHLTDRGEYLEITVPKDSKTGERDVKLIPGSAALRYWIEEGHPAHLETESGPSPETLVWTHHNKNQPIVYGTLAAVFRRAAEKVGIDESRASPQNCRRSCASYAASVAGMSEQDLRDQFGWSRFSTAPHHYIRRFGPGRTQNLAEGYGMSIENIDELDPIAPIRCERCHKFTTRHLDNCLWCQLSIDEDQQTLPTAVEKPGIGDMDLNDKVLHQHVTADELKTLKKLEPHIKSEPEIFDTLPELITAAERLEEDQEQTVNSVAGLIGLVTESWSALKGWALDKHSGMSISPYFEDYPLRGEKRVGFAVFCVVYTAGIFSIMHSNGSLERLANGNPVEITGLVIGLSLGFGLISWAMPGVEDGIEELRDAPDLRED
jgi:integrase